MKKTAIQTGQYLLILFFLYYYVGITAFVHTHQIAQFTITHSHPLLPGTHHSHTPTGYDTINLLNVLFADLAPVLSVCFALAIIGLIYQFYRYSVPQQGLYHPSLRAPPYAVLG